MNSCERMWVWTHIFEKIGMFLIFDEVRMA